MNKEYNSLIIKACQRVQKNSHLSVSLDSFEYYGIHHWSEKPVYKVILNFDEKKIIIYPIEPAFQDWTHVPWSGQESFKPEDFDSWPENKKLILAWCWAIYNYCTHYGEYHDGGAPKID